MTAAPRFPGTTSQTGDDLRRLQQKLGRFQRVDLAHLPTPLEKLAALSRALGRPHLFVKRDDQTGLAFGGNKARKLEFIMADALRQKADVVVTWAGIQSNWARQTAAAAAKLAMKCVLVLTGRDDSPPPYDGNLLLDFLLGADIRILGPQDDRAKVVQEIVQEQARQGRKAYVVSVGGSQVSGSMEQPLGALAYANAFLETHRQAESQGIKLAHLVLATGSGSTQAGLVVGARAIGAKTKIIGISVSGQAKAVQKTVADIASAAAASLELRFTVSPEEIIVFDKYVGEGYGVLTQEAAEAIALSARQEGLMLDPVYTGKAMAGLLDLLRQGYFGKEDSVMFLHTGGTPALFAYRDRLTELLGRTRS